MKKIFLILFIGTWTTGIALGQKFRGFIGPNFNQNRIGYGIGVGFQAGFQYKPIKYLAVGLEYAMPNYKYALDRDNENVSFTELRLNIRGVYDFGKNEVFAYIFGGPMFGQRGGTNPKTKHYVVGGGVGYTRWLSEHSGIYVSGEADYGLFSSHETLNFDGKGFEIINKYSTHLLNVSIGYTFRF